MNISTQSAEIIIADSQFLITEGLKAVLEQNYKVSAVVSTQKDLLKELNRKTPGVLIMDHAQLDFESIDDVKELKFKYPELPIIIITNSVSRNEVVEINGCGIRNIIHKTVGQEELFECIDAAIKGKRYFSGQVLDLLMESPEKKEISGSKVQLTASEIEIVRLLSQGLTNKDIAQKKFLSVHTIMTHRKNIMRKLGASNASEMIMFAIRLGLIDNIEYHI